MQGLWNLIGKGQGPGRDFTYEIGEQISNCAGKSVWTIQSGKNKVNGSPVTVFTCDAKTSPPDEFQVAKNACKRLRSFRHPNVLRFVDSFESDALIHLVTEPVVPLVSFLETQEGKNPNILAWGIHQIAVALSFLVNDSGLCHGNMNVYAVFVDPAGEWKLGAVEYVHPYESDPVARLASMGRYDPPEGKAAKRAEKWSADSWGFGCLCWEIFNEPMQRSSELKAVKKIPRNLLPHYCELVTANPQSRLNPKDFLQRCKQNGQYLSNDFVKANLFLQEIQIKDINEQREFFKSLNKSLDSFPNAFCVHKILPELLKAFQFGAVGSAVLAPLFKIGKLLGEEEYQKQIVPCVVKLFSSNDRATRIQLLQQMDNFVQHLQPAIVNNQVFPNVATGFGDTLPAMRENTVKAMILLTPKLSEKTINNQLLRYFAKLQMDEQPGIRTNTTICLGKIAAYLPEATRHKVLVPAFLRSMRDPFPPARSSGILALAATQEFYSLQDVASKILPSLCSATIDPEKTVRDNAFKAIRTYLGKVEYASNNPESNFNSKDGSSQSEAGSSSWTGWAVSSLTSRIYGQQQQQQQQQQNEKTAPERSQQQKSENERTTSQASGQENRQVQSSHALDADSSWNDDADDNWDDLKDDDAFSSIKDDLKGAKKDLSDVTKFHVQDKGDVAGDSDSDYGDWGSDDWGFNDSSPTKQKANAKSQALPPKKKTLQETAKKTGTTRGAHASNPTTPRSVADILGMDGSTSDDFFGAGSLAANTNETAPSNYPGWDTQDYRGTANQEAGRTSSDLFQSRPFQDSAPEQQTETVHGGSKFEIVDSVAGAGWNVEEEDWGSDPAGDWARQDENDVGSASSAITACRKQDDKDAKKAELLKKREERRQQREQSAKDRKQQKVGGALKLGAVKRVAKSNLE
eukprot:gene20441-22457_t